MPGQNTIRELERMPSVSECRREGLIGLSGDQTDGFPSLLFPK